MSVTKEWFEDWFSSPYYDLLYAHRDEKEAAAFLDSLLLLLAPRPGDRFWDLACGKGRHSVYLANKGYKVTGTDLSEPFIRFARQTQLPNLIFHRQDMRDDPPGQDFDFVLNLFTAFGYFSTREDDLTVLRQVHRGLKKSGVFVLDYLNVSHALATLIPEETVLRNTLEVRIRRQVANNRITKDIAILDSGHWHYFQESVQCLQQADFMEMFRETGFSVVRCLGDYSGNDFNLTTSPRMIWILQKK